MESHEETNSYLRTN